MARRSQTKNKRNRAKTAERVRGVQRQRKKGAKVPNELDLNKRAVKSHGVEKSRALAPKSTDGVPGWLGLNSTRRAAVTTSLALMTLASFSLIARVAVRALPTFAEIAQVAGAAEEFYHDYFAPGALTVRAASQTPKAPRTENHRRRKKAKPYKAPSPVLRDDPSSENHVMVAPGPQECRDDRLEGRFPALDLRSSIASLPSGQACREGLPYAGYSLVIPSSRTDETPHSAIETIYVDVTQTVDCGQGPFKPGK